MPRIQKNVLLVGGAGYIGTAMTADFLKRGYRVRSLDNLIYKNQRCVLPFVENDMYEFLYGDLANPSDVAKALDGMTDVVVLAGLVGDPITKKYPVESELINDKGVFSFLEAANKTSVERLIFVSTCSNYGLREDNSLATEQSELKPLSLYAKSKVQAEEKLLQAKGSLSYKPTILRFATAFGLAPRMRFDLTVNEFSREMFLKRPLVVYDADTWRPYCHVKDFSRAVCTVLESSPDKVAFEVFNVGSEKNNFTKKMIVDSILEFLPDAPVEFKAHGTDPRNYRVSFEKIRKVLDFEPQFSVKRGIQEQILAMQQHLFDAADDEKNFHGNYEIFYTPTVR